MKKVLLLNGGKNFAHSEGRYNATLHQAALAFLDRAGFDAAMAQQKAAARAAWKGSGDKASDEIWYDIAETQGGTEFIGYGATEGEATVIALVKDGVAVDEAKAGDELTVLTNQTPFYGESGGQMGDSGTIATLDGAKASVSDTGKPLGRLHAHHAKLEAGSLKVGDTVQLTVDAERRDRIRANHSATHLLHAALRNRLGGHVTQKGSLVAEDRFRFDFSHPKALSAEEIADVEADVNAQIRGNEAVTTRLMTPDDAVAAGALALFGEKYGDEVRVLSMGKATDNHYSVELCGGTHVRALGDIGLFVITSEGGVSAGVRRLEARTGEEARSWLMGKYKTLAAIEETIGNFPDVLTKATQLRDENKKLQKELADAKKALAMGGGGAASGPAVEQVGDTAFIAQVVDGLDPKELRGTVDGLKKQVGSGVAMLVAVNDGRASVAVGVTEGVAHNAVDLVKLAVAALGGQGGGGRPDMAQGGGPDGGAADSAVAAVKAALV